MNTPKFEFLSPISVMLINVNPRKELHGEEHVQAIDLSFKADFPNTILDQVLAVGLCDSLYYNRSAESGQESLDGIDAVAPNLRFPKLNGQRFTWGGKDKLVGYTITLEFGLGDAVSNIELELCKVSGRVFEVKEGGTIVLSWKVQNASDRLDMDTCGKLVLLGSEEVTMTLRAPVVHAEEPDEEPESPFLDDDPAPLDSQDPMTPEQALLDSVEAES